MSKTQVLPKIRTSMQMSKASIDALKTEQQQKEFLQHLTEALNSGQSNKAPLKKILKIQHFQLVEDQETGSEEEQKAREGKTVTVGRAESRPQTRSHYQTPTSDSVHKKTTFSEIAFLASEAKKIDSRARRMSALVPSLPHIFKDDHFSKTIQTLSIPNVAELPAAFKTVSSDELENSSRSIVAVQDLRRAAFRRSSTKKFDSVSPSTVGSPVLMTRRVMSPQNYLRSGYLLETAKVLGRTQDIRKRHPTQRIPKRLFKDIV